MKTINMLSKADSVEGQGVLSAYLEQVSLVRTELSDLFEVSVNEHKCCDIMHYHTINFRYFCSIPFAKRKGVTVGYVHFLPETLENSVHLPWLIQHIFYRYVIRFYKSMDKLVTVNPYFIDRLEYYGVPRKRVTYIPNFVSSEQFFPMDESQKIAARKEYNLDKDTFTVLCAGQLQKRKGFLDFADLARKMPDVTFLWAGTFAFGKISDGYKEIKEISENPPPNLKLLGLIPREKMNELYNVADVMFLPSYEELFPMTILESMNCKTPILLRDLDIYHNILFDYYLRGKDNDDFEKEIRRLKEDQSYRQEASARSNKGHVFYSREHVAQMWREFYTGITK